MSKVAEKIVAEIRNTGAMRVSRFMELALYCPVYGYYEKEADNPGRRGDYYTSVSVGATFGQLLAWQFGTWSGESEAARTAESPILNHRSQHGNCDLEKAPSQRSEGGAVQLIEAGAGTGQLARDILSWTRERRPDFFERAEYWIIEPSEQRQQWQRRNLAEFGTRVRWVSELGELGAGQAAYRIVFSNELLDAFPVRRLGWDAAKHGWFEWGVTVDDSRLVWERLTAPVVGAPDPGPLGGVMPDGFLIDWCPAAAEWWRRAASLVHRGKLLTFDYGLTSEELISPARRQGTLRAYQQHQVSTEVLEEPGERDITAHVNFTDLELAGQAAGLKTEQFETQAHFLTRIVASVMSGGTCFGEWTASHTRQFQTLTHPEHLGRAFRVLVQGR